MDVEADSLSERSEVDWLLESDFDSEANARDSEQDVHCEVDRLSETDRENDPDSETDSLSEIDVSSDSEVLTDWVSDTDSETD